LMYMIDVYEINVWSDEEDGRHWSKSDLSKGSRGLSSLEVILGSPFRFDGCDIPGNRTVVEELSLRDFGDECSFVLEDGGPSFNCLNVAFAAFTRCEETGKSSGKVFELCNA